MKIDRKETILKIIIGVLLIISLVIALSTNPPKTNYIGKYEDNELNTLEVTSYTENKITFTWSLYRITTIEDLSIDLIDNCGEIYYEGEFDESFDDKITDDEKYIRKLSISLKDTDITIEIENVNSIPENGTRIEKFDGAYYITPSTYTYKLSK